MGCNCGMQIASSKTLRYGPDKSWLNDFSLTSSNFVLIGAIWSRHLALLCTYSQQLPPFHSDLLSISTTVLSRSWHLFNVNSVFILKEKSGLQPAINRYCSSKKRKEQQAKAIHGQHRLSLVNTKQSGCPGGLSGLRTCSYLALT